jgi:Cd2+/Zn2+-exporting ATPase
VNVETLRVGDVIAVRAGDMIQADGIVVKGEGVIDESALTGL